MQCPICIVSARNTSISASVTSGCGSRSLFKSVKVVMVISVSLHHQQCYNFHKIQQENTKWTGAVIYMKCFTVSFPPGAPCKSVYYTSLRARGPCPLLTWSTLKTIRGTCWDWTAGRLTTGCWAVWLQVWHPWLVLETSLVLRHAITWGRFVFTFTVPNQFRNLVWGQEPTFLWSSTHDCWQTNIQSSQEVTQWNAILFQLYYCSTIYRPVCLFPYIKLRWNYNPVEFCQQGLSISL